MHSFWAFAGGKRSNLDSGAGVEENWFSWIRLAGKRRREWDVGGQGHKAGLDGYAPQSPALIICQERCYEEEATLFPILFWEWREGKARPGGCWKAWSASLRNLHGYMEGHQVNVAGAIPPWDQGPPSQAAFLSWPPVLCDPPTLHSWPHPPCSA